jgi:hypothetical protein
MTAAAKHEPSTMASTTASTTASASASATGLRQRMSCWLALQAMLGLGLVCGVVYLVIATTLTERQDDTLDQKQAIVRHLVADERATHEAAGIEHTLDDFLAGHENLALRLQAADGGLWYDRPTRQGEAPQLRAAGARPGDRHDPRRIEPRHACR